MQVHLSHAWGQRTRSYNKVLTVVQRASWQKWLLSFVTKIGNDIEIACLTAQREKNSAAGDKHLLCLGHPEFSTWVCPPDGWLCCSLDSRVIEPSEDLFQPFSTLSMETNIRKIRIEHEEIPSHRKPAYHILLLSIRVWKQPREKYGETAFSRQ